MYRTDFTAQVPTAPSDGVAHAPSSCAATREFGKHATVSTFYPQSSRPPVDDPICTLDPKAETIKHGEDCEEVKDRERTDPDTAGSPAVSAALAAPLLPAAPADQSAAAAAPATRKVRPRPFRIPRSN